MRFCFGILALLVFSHVCCTEKRHVTFAFGCAINPWGTPGELRTPVVPGVKEIPCLDPPIIKPDPDKMSLVSPPEIRNFRRGSLYPNHLRLWEIRTYLHANNVFFYLLKKVPEESPELDIACKCLISSIKETRRGALALALGQAGLLRHEGWDTMGYVNGAKNALKSALLDDDIQFLCDFMLSWVDAIKRDMNYFESFGTEEIQLEYLKMFEKVSAAYDTTP